MVSTPGGEAAHTRAMSEIDRERISAVRRLEAMGYVFRNGEWQYPESPQPLVSSVAEADRLHTLLVMRADELAGAAEGSLEEIELRVIAEAPEAYEAVRWPDGRVPGGKA
jgi:hypothetical protein